MAFSEGSCAAELAVSSADDPARPLAGAAPKPAAPEDVSPAARWPLAGDASRSRSLTRRPAWARARRRTSSSLVEPVLAPPQIAISIPSSSSIARSGTFSAL